MRDPERIEEMLDEIRRVWKENPDLRLAQIIVNVHRTHRADCTVSSLFNMEDDILLRNLREDFA